MKKIIIIVIALTVLASIACWSEPSLEGRPLVELESKSAKVVVDLAGGSIVDFHLLEQGLNPLTWNYPEKGDLEPRTIGHFICFDRWGQPSRAEGKNGMPFHGEATKILWQKISDPVIKDGKVFAEMSCELPIGGMKLYRKLNLDEKEAVLTVTEEITNINKLGRVYNIVQHATIGPPFLDASMVIDTNVKKGFLQSGRMPFPEEPAIYWPKTVFDGRLIDLQRLSDDVGPGVTTYIIDENEEYGWATACNAPKGLLIGYIWKAAEYPWLNMWRNVRNDKPAAFGIEFGTTGLHQPFGVLLEKDEIFGCKLYEYIDANETSVKSYTAFLARIPGDYKGVTDIQIEDGKITLKERGGDNSRDIVVKIK